MLASPTPALPEPAANPPAPLRPTAAAGIADRPRRPGIDERRHRRARADWPARLVGASGAIVAGRVCDVSEGGIGLLSEAHMRVGALVRIALALPMVGDPRRSVPLCCQGRVVFCAFVGKSSRTGLQFIALPTTARRAIRAYLLAHS